VQPRDLTAFLKLGSAETEDRKINNAVPLLFAILHATFELRRLTNFSQRLVVPGPEGTVMHSELTLGDAVIMVATLCIRQRFVVYPLRLIAGIWLGVSHASLHHA